MANDEFQDLPADKYPRSYTPRMEGKLREAARRSAEEEEAKKPIGTRVLYGDVTSAGERRLYKESSQRNKRRSSR